MNRKSLLLLILLSLSASVSCALVPTSSTTTTLTTESQTTTTTTEDALLQFAAASEEFLLDFASYPTWYYESRFHLFETGYAENEGIWYYDQFNIDFSIPYAYRHIASNTAPSGYLGYEISLYEVYENVNGCLSARIPKGLGVSIDSFLAESATRETMMESLPAQPAAILSILANEGIERIEENHYRITMQMSRFLDFSEFIAVFDKYKHNINVDYDQETFLFDVYFEEEQVRIVALVQNYSSGETYDYNTTIYIRRIDEATRFEKTLPVDYFCPPDDIRLIIEPLAVPLAIKVYLCKEIYGFVRVDLEPGTYRVYTDDIYGPSHFTNIQLFDANMEEFWGNNIVVATAGTYYIRLQSPYEVNTTKLYVVPVV